MKNRIHWILSIALLLLFTAPVQASDTKCKFSGKNFVKGYLQCLEREDPRYSKKAKGYTTMGNLYEFGINVPKHYGQAAMYYQMACEYADGNGCVYLARLYKQGKGVRKNLRKAKKLFKRSYYMN